MDGRKKNNSLTPLMKFLIITFNCKKSANYHSYFVLNEVLFHVGIFPDLCQLRMTKKTTIKSQF